MVNDENTVLNPTEMPFIRIDLMETSENTKVTFIRLDASLRNFLNKVIEKHEIEAVILPMQDGKISWNLGFTIKEK